jgi:hypothetical protein
MLRSSVGELKLCVGAKKCVIKLNKVLKLCDTRRKSVSKAAHFYDGSDVRELKLCVGALKVEECGYGGVEVT